MLLEISNCDNCYNLKGSLTEKNLHTFTLAFKNIFSKISHLTINIEGLNSIDREGVNVITRLHNKALTSKKKLTIIGLGNKELYEHFKSNDAA